MQWYIRTLLKLFLRKGVSKSYSQFGEDMVVKSLLRQVRKGIYVDVGCYDPVLYSNTYYFYKKGWSGIAIDPNPNLASRYRLMRPRDKFICAGVGLGQKNYQQHSDGAHNSFTDGPGMSLEKLSDLTHDLPHIDFLSIDVEGLEMDVLATIDWDKRPKVIAIEDQGFTVENSAEDPVYQFLKGKGYLLSGICGLTLIWRDSEK